MLKDDTRPITFTTKFTTAIAPDYHCLAKFHTLCVHKSKLKPECSMSILFFTKSYRFTINQQLVHVRDHQLRKISNLCLTAFRCNKSIYDRLPLPHEPNGQTKVRNATGSILLHQNVLTLDVTVCYCWLSLNNRRPIQSAYKQQLSTTAVWKLNKENKRRWRGREREKLSECVTKKLQQQQHKQRIRQLNLVTREKMKYYKADDDSENLKWSTKTECKVLRRSRWNTTYPGCRVSLCGGE